MVRVKGYMRKVAGSKRKVRVKPHNRKKRAKGKRKSRRKRRR